MYRCRVGATHHRFDNLRTLLACASPLRSGDQLAGIAAADNERRIAARYCLADVTLRDIVEQPVLPYEQDEVTRLILDSHDAAAFVPISALTVGAFREWLLREETDACRLSAVAPGLTPEIVAAVSKLMTNLDLISVAMRCRRITCFRTTLGQEGVLASRLQPNHPVDDPLGMLGSTIAGLLFGMGDAVIGINPASDNFQSCVTLLQMLEDLRLAYDIPMQSCVLSHVTTMIAAAEAGAPVDLIFQSVAGSEKANAGFGINLALLREAEEAGRQLGRIPPGGNFMYFETGQGSALSSDAHHGVDQQTMEVRAHAVARAFNPLIVNTVVGFIGPEYLYDTKQIIRAGLEDVFCGKLLGLPMGADVCYTNHAEADQDDMDTLGLLLTSAGAHFLIAVPGADDIMLNYQSLSYHDIATLRRITGRTPAPEFAAWLEHMGIADANGQLLPHLSQDSRAQRLLAAH